jgi:hypothetical protein
MNVFGESRKRRFRLSLLLLLGGIILLLLIPPLHSGDARSAGNDLILELRHPDNGQIFYAGAIVPRYVLPVLGSVYYASGEVTTVEVNLQVFQNGHQVSQVSGYPDRDGKFKLYITPNPDNPVMGTTADMKSCEVCHGVYDSAALPAGECVIRVIVTSPDGQRASAERHVFVDRSAYQQLVVHATQESGGSLPMEGIPVVATTTFPVQDDPFAAQQSRHFKGVTNADGSVSLKIEVLNAIPTQYHIHVPKTLNEGKQVFTEKPVELSLAPGAESVSPVNLPIQVVEGLIQGEVRTQVSHDFTGMSAYAIEKAGGRNYSDEVQVKGSGTGEFKFTGLPISRYLVGFPDPILQQKGLSGKPQSVDLETQPHQAIQLDLASSQENIIQGSIRSRDGRKLAFGWVRDDASGRSVRLSPMEDRFELIIPAQGTRIISIIAPGYWSSKWAIQTSQTTDSAKELSLTPRSDLKVRELKGNGEIYIPAESRAAFQGNQLDLTTGWVWGRSGDAVLSILVAGHQVRLDPQTEFALERLQNQTPWIYIGSGGASVTLEGVDQRIHVSEGQMFLFSSGTALPPAGIDFDPAVFGLLHADEQPVLSYQEEPGFSARIHDWLARMGLGAIQGVTLLTYLAVVLVVILAPLLLIYWLLRKRSHKEAS